MHAIAYVRVKSDRPEHRLQTQLAPSHNFSSSGYHVVSSISEVPLTKKTDPLPKIFEAKTHEA